jgi:hypothetical protein
MRGSASDPGDSDEGSRPASSRRGRIPFAPPPLPLPLLGRTLPSIIAGQGEGKDSLGGWGSCAPPSSITTTPMQIAEMASARRTAHPSQATGAEPLRSPILLNHHPMQTAEMASARRTAHPYRARIGRALAHPIRPGLQKRTHLPMSSRGSGHEKVHQPPGRQRRGISPRTIAETFHRVCTPTPHPACIPSGAKRPVAQRREARGPPAETLLHRQCQRAGGGRMFLRDGGSFAPPIPQVSHPPLRHGTSP